ALPTEVAAPCTILLVPAAGWWLLVAGRRVRQLVQLHRSCRHLRTAGALVVLDDARPDAFTTPQPAGRIVVTTGLLHALTPLERRVGLAHEASHPVHPHAPWLAGADPPAPPDPPPPPPPPP